MSIASRITSIEEHIGNAYNKLEDLGVNLYKLPVDYTQLEYIEGTGTQYINTNYNPVQGDNFELKYVRMSASNSPQAIMWAGTEGNQLVLLFLSSSLYYRYFNIGGDAPSFVIGYINGNIKITDEKFYYNDELKMQSTYAGAINGTLQFFRRPNNDSSYANMRLGEVIITNNNVKKHHYVPCKRNSDNEVGLYDLVNGVFYTNQGTGTFTAGEISKETIDKNIDNIAEMLDTVYEDYPKVTGTGTEVTLNGTKAGKLGLDVKGNSTQETTTGKNKLNPNAISGTKNGITYSYDSDTQIYTFNGTCTADNTLINSIAKEVIEFTNGTTTVSVHYVSGSATGGKVQFLTSGYAGTTVDFANISSSSPIKSQVATSTYTPTLFNSRIIFNNGFVLNNLKIKIMVANSTDTSYEPYTGGIASPNPSYPQTIYSAGDEGSISEKIVNKNLFDTNNLTNGYLTSSGNITTTNQYRVSDYIDVSSSLYVTISGSAGASEYNCFYDVNKNFVNKNNMGTNTTKTITVPSNAMYIRCTVKKENIDTYQVELNSTATTYTAHAEQTYTIPVQQPMRSIGTVRDEFINVNEEWKERHNIAYIESYNGETITTDYISTTGGLDIGASVQYILETPVDLPCTAEQIAILENMPKSYNEQTNIYSLDVTTAYVEAKALKE